MIICLIIDNPKRDLKGLAILGYDLVNAGHTVFLTPMKLQEYEIERILPDVMLTSGFRRSTYPMYKRFKDIGVGIAVLETEGGFMYNEELLKQRVENHPDSNSVVDLFFCWGAKYKEIVENYTPISQNKVYVTGHPRFELKKTISTLKEKYILFAPNFAYLRDGKLNEVLHRQLLRDTGVDIRQNFEGFLDYYMYFLDLVKKAASLYPDQVVYRPHPFDDIHFLKKELGNIQIRFDENTTISDTLIDTAICIQNSSTTGFEALLYGVPTLIPTGVSSGFRSKEIDEMSQLIDREEEIFKYINMALNGQIKQSDDAVAAFRYVCDVSKDASLEILKLLESRDFKNTKKQPVSYSSALLPARKRLKRALKNFKKGRIGHLQFDLTYSYYDDWRSSEKFFTPEMVIEVLKKYRGAKIQATKMEYLSSGKKFESIELNRLNIW